MRQPGRGFAKATQPQTTRIKLRSYRGSQMISECFNPSCRRELRYLRDGRVVRVIRDDLRVEHFWLCGSCHLQYDFWFTDGKALSIGPQMRGARRLKMKPEIQWIEERMAS
jgi:hypothetical protein